MAGNETGKLPQRIGRIEDVAYNLWWTWNPSARALFKSMDMTLWRETNHNPVRMLGKMRAADLRDRAKDPAFLQAYDSVIAQFEEYTAPDRATWFKRSHPEHQGMIAYYSAEFGVHQSLPIYSGGLGILAGDHCKTASDLGVPLAGVGFMYPEGYVQQRLGIEGWQQNHYERLDRASSPVRPACRPDGSPCVLTLDIGGWHFKIAVWRVQVGRVPLILMDTNVEGNDLRDREVSNRLYGGDRSTRLRQEIVLGMGGLRVLRELGLDIRLFHINEGHAAFMLLERLRELVAQGRSFAEARRVLSGEVVFTTHTPVEAGHDVFEEPLIEEYFKDFWPSLGLDREAFMGLARVPGEDGWNMTALALRLAGRTNGVSRPNGEVCRKMWRKLYEGRPAAEVPITHVTNGVHLPTWVCQSMAEVYDLHLGKDWKERQDDPAMWARIAKVPDEAVWEHHARRKHDLMNFIRSQVRARWMRDRIDPMQVLAHGSMLDPDALTIGFSRRFAPYKRATLILRDLGRLRQLLLDPWRPVQLVFAGKAHPADDGGKKLIQQVYNLAKDPEIGGHIAFVEDYDMHKAHYLVSGVDLWLNNPLAPLEACGTSGQKAAVNGVPNLSILDGWWEEGYNRQNGWAPKATTHLPEGERDDADAQGLYDVLEEQIIPLFYDRGRDGVPHGWVRVMKESIQTVGPVFCSDRMLKDYVAQLYLPGKLARKEATVAA